MNLLGLVLAQNYLACLLLASPLLACQSDDDPVGPDAGVASDAMSPSGDATSPGEVPIDPDALFAFLQAGDYLAFDAESAVHTSSGPHASGGIRTFVNPILATSLAAGGVTHPTGAAAIKELYGADGTTVTGWAASIKTQAESAAGAGWYWYEVFSTTNGSNPLAGQGLALCADCHEQGADYVLIPFPLQ